MNNLVELYSKIYGKSIVERNINIIICDNYELMSKKCANMISEIVKSKKDALICLPAGDTSKGTFKYLIEMQNKGEVNFNEVKFVALDDWLGLEDETENCNSFMNKNFYHPMGIKDSQVFRFNLHADDMSSECKRIDKLIFDHGKIDCMLLGIGMNGHLGMNEPNENFDNYTKIIDLDPITSAVGQKYFTKKVTLKRGITLGLRHIFESKMVILQANGFKKANIIKRLNDERININLPASILRIIENSYLIIDKDAASKL